MQGSVLELTDTPNVSLDSLALGLCALGSLGSTDLMGGGACRQLSCNDLPVSAGFIRLPATHEAAPTKCTSKQGCNC